MKMLLGKFVMVPLIAVLAFLHTTLSAVLWRGLICGAMIFGPEAMPLWLRGSAIAALAAMVFALIPAIRIYRKDIRGRLKDYEPVWVSVALLLTMIPISGFVLNVWSEDPFAHWMGRFVFGFVVFGVVYQAQDVLRFYLRVRREGEENVAKNLVQGVVDDSFDHEDFAKDMADLRHKLREKSKYHNWFVDGPLADEQARVSQMHKMGLI